MNSECLYMYTISKKKLYNIGNFLQWSDKVSWILWWQQAQAYVYPHSHLDLHCLHAFDDAFFSLTRNATFSTCLFSLSTPSETVPSSKVQVVHARITLCTLSLIFAYTIHECSMTQPCSTFTARLQNSVECINPCPAEPRYTLSLQTV